MLWGIGIAQTHTCCSPNQNAYNVKVAKDATSTDGKQMSKYPNLFAILNTKPSLNSKQVAKSQHSHSLFYKY